MALKSADLESSSSQYFSVADSADLSLTGDCTFEFWLKIESNTADTTAVISKDTSGDNRSYFVYINSGYNQLRFINSNDGTAAGATDIGVATTFTVGEWHHYALVYTAASGQIEVYRDGVSAGTATGADTSIFNGTQDLNIGRWNRTNSNFYDGLIDEVRIWNDVRTATEISDNYQKRLNGDEQGLVAYYTFDDDTLEDKGITTDPTGAVADDLTNNGTITFSTDVPFTEAAVVTPPTLLILGVG